MLTVLFATRNGARTLPHVLEAYRQLASPRGGWKLVIVDNGSTDGSPQIIAGFDGRLPLTYLFEGESGKNVALNSGLARISGDLVVLTDDDAVPRPDWLARLRETADANPAFGIFGGAVRPRWETAPPSWLCHAVPLGPTYTVSDLSWKEGPVCGSYVFGPNMAIRTEIFDAGHRFDPGIGPTRSCNYAMGSETEFVLRVMGHGVRAWYAPAAVVEHFIRTTQMQPSWIVGRAIRFGRGQCRLRLRLPDQVPAVWGFQRPPGLTPRCLGFPLPLLYHLGRKCGELLVALLRFNRGKLLFSAWAMSYVCGYACEARDASRTSGIRTSKLRGG